MTNSCLVRPIDRELIAVLKPTVVIPLMWETWEFRSFDFDFNYCKERGIVVLGTNERQLHCDMLGSIGLCSLKLLFELGFDGGKVFLMGNTHSLAFSMKISSGELLSINSRFCGGYSEPS